ncbi:MAG: hypothetical protein E7566_03365 [Ruminococcaceae bacterium]|nr:hypothetical protein [Oscillospiraceae bacterium]
MIKGIKKDMLLLGAGGILYAGIELLWRQRTHWTMVLTGGVCFLSIYKLYRRYPKMSVPEKCVCGSAIITGIEFLVGCFVNLKMGWRVWDYSSMPLNLLGQVCLLYSVLWGLLCIPLSKVCKKIDIIMSRYS